MSARVSSLRSDSPNSRSTWLAVLGFGLLLVVVGILLRTPNADGFELSVYSAYPVYFWALIVLVLFIGQLLILREGLASTPTPKNWHLGFLLSLLVTTILLFMPYIRGYQVYGRADLLTHLGHVVEIQETGGDPFMNIYQNLHQLFLALSYATGVESLYLVNAVAGVISLFFIVSSYALLAAIFDRRRLLLTLPFVVVLVGGSAHLNPSPYAMSVMLFPFVFYLFVRAQETESFAFRAPLAVGAVALVLYHPLTAIFLFLILATYYAVISRPGLRREWTLSEPVSRVTATSALQLTVVVFLAWYYNFAGIIIRFETAITTVIDPDEGEGDLDRYGEAIAEFTPDPIDIATVAFYNYGNRAVILGIGSLFVVAATWSYIRGNRAVSPYQSMFTFGFVLFSALGAVFLVVGLIGGFGRPLMFAQFFAVFLAGSLLAALYDRVERQSLVTAGASLLLIVLVVACVAVLYNSPMGGATNQQVTEQDFAGAEWYLENDLQDSLLKEHGTTMYRFEHALLGSDSATVQRVETALPPRLNYTEHPTLGESYDADQVVVVTERGKQFYPTAYPEYEPYWRYHPDDFERLSVDPTVTQVYENNEVSIYRVEAASG